MNVEEREVVLEGLRLSEARLLALVGGLNAEQWGFREAEDRWSIAEIVEHLTVFEEFIRGAILRAMTQSPDSEKMALAAAKEPLVLGLAESRGEAKFVAREATRPMGRWGEPTESVAEFCAARARTVAFVRETDADLRGHFFAHIAFGDLDCYQWLVLLGQHTFRHCLQVEEILGNSGFPAGHDSSHSSQPMALHPSDEDLSPGTPMNGAPGAAGDPSLRSG